MMFCRHCGAQMHETAVACPQCGALSEVPQIVPPSGYFSFQGRIGRKVYWLHYVIPLALLEIAGSAVDEVVFGYTAIFGPLMTLLCLIPNLGAAVKRCHDRDRSGVFLLMIFVPLIGALWLLIELGFLEGTVGGNRYGSDPLLGRLGGAYRRPGIP